jgi:hypothetical protein
MKPLKRVRSAKKCPSQSGDDDGPRMKPRDENVALALEMESGSMF